MKLDLSLSEIVEAISGEILLNNNEGNFNKISTDTRKIEKDNLFIALTGENFNGNDYVCKAIEKGASIIIIISNRNCTTTVNWKKVRGG